MRGANKHGLLEHLIYRNAAVCLLAITAHSSSGTAPAQQWPVSPRLSHDRAVMLQTADLERAFWMCDYTATLRGVYATPIETCAAITDELQQHKFDGSFEEMLIWWQFNKPAEHDKLATRTGPALEESSGPN